MGRRGLGPEQGKYQLLKVEQMRPGQVDTIFKSCCRTFTPFTPEKGPLWQFSGREVTSITINFLTPFIGRLTASGVKDSYHRYDPDISYQKFWKKTDRFYRYLGITTFRRDIKKFMNSDGQHLQYAFLLLDPQSPFLRQLERERLGLALDDRSEATEKVLDEHVTSKRKEFEATVAAIRHTRTCPHQGL